MKRMIIEHVEIRLTEDSYNEGQNPDTTTSYEMDHLRGKSFTNVDELSKILDMRLTVGDLTAFENRVLTSYMVDEAECELSPAEEKRWKLGEFKAFCKDIDILVKIVEDMPSEQEQIAEFLGIQQY